MSDTQSKIEKRRQEARKRQELNKKRANAKIKHSTVQKIQVTCAVVIAVILLAALILPSMGITRRVLTAVTIGDTKISTAEYSYYYRSSFQNYYNTMVSYLGEDNVPIDTGRSLKKQDMSEDQTYADYFSSNAVNQLTELVVWASEAEKEGFTLPEESRQQLDDLMAQLEIAAQSSNMTVDSYLSANYGLGFNRDLFEKCAERELLVEAYKEAKYKSYSYTQDQLEDYYQENEKDFETVDFRIETFNQVEASEDTDGITADEAKAGAEAFVADNRTEQEFAEAARLRAQENMEEGEVAEDDSLATNVTYSSASQLDTNLAEWLFADDVKAGDSTVIESAAGTSFYAVYMVRTKERDETKTVDVRHILIQVSDTSDEEAMKEAKAEAESLLQQWKDAGATEEAFAELAAGNSDDSGSASEGGLYTGVKPGDMVSGFDDWCFDAARKKGDTGIVETEYGYHVMYYVQQNDQTTWQAKVEDSMRETDYSAFYEAASANYPVETHSLGIYFRNEPI